MANNATKTTATTAPVAEPTVVGTSGYRPELTQRVWVPGLGDTTRAGKPRVNLGATRDGRRAIQFASAKRGQGGYGASKLFAVSDCERFGPLASQLGQALADAGQGLLLEVDAFEVILPGGNSLWRISAFRQVERTERDLQVDPWAEVRQAQAAYLDHTAARAAQADKPARPARPATGWQTAPIGDVAEGDDSLPF